MQHSYLCEFMASFRGSSTNSSRPAEMNLIQVKLSFLKSRTFLSCLWEKVAVIAGQNRISCSSHKLAFLWLSRGSSLVIVYCLCLNGHPISTEMTTDPHQRLLKCRVLPARRWTHMHTKVENSPGLSLNIRLWIIVGKTDGSVLFLKRKRQSYTCPKSRVVIRQVPLEWLR